MYQFFYVSNYQFPKAEKQKNTKLKQEGKFYEKK